MHFLINHIYDRERLWTGRGEPAGSYGCWISHINLPTHLPMYAQELTCSPTHALPIVIRIPKCHTDRQTPCQNCNCYTNCHGYTKRLSNTAKCPPKLSNTRMLMMLMMSSQNCQIPECSITTNKPNTCMRLMFLHDLRENAQSLSVKQKYRTWMNKSQSHT